MQELPSGSSEHLYLFIYYYYSIIVIT